MFTTCLISALLAATAVKLADVVFMKGPKRVAIFAADLLIAALLFWPVVVANTICNVADCPRLDRFAQKYCDCLLVSWDRFVTE